MNWFDNQIKIRIWVVGAGLLCLCFAWMVLQPTAHLDEDSPSKQIRERAIGDLLDKKELTQNDYEILFQQTGLGASAIKQIREKKGYKKEEILRFQKYYLSDYQEKCVAKNWFTRQDRIVWNHCSPVPIAPLENGDILLSFSSHSLGWRHGHAGLVVDAEEKLSLEAVTPGSLSRIKSLEHWRSYSGFAVLRLRGASKKRRNAIANYACKKLDGIPYNLFSGIFKAKEDTKGQISAQCAYLIWYAFFHFGYDLDSDGGRIVTVSDLAKSTKLEVVQIFGTYPYD